MDKQSTTIAKIIAFAAVVLLCAGVPHFWHDRAQKAPRILLDPRSANLLPDNVGSYSVRNRSNFIEFDSLEQVAIYSDKSGAETVQADLRLNSGHNGLNCYIARGIPVVWSGLEEVQAADSTAIFDVKILKGASVVTGGYSMYLLAATQCNATKCTENLMPIEDRIGIRLGAPAVVGNGVEAVPLSIVIESSSATASKDQLIRQLRVFMKDMPLVPLGQYSALQAASHEQAMHNK